MAKNEKWNLKKSQRLIGARKTIKFRAIYEIHEIGGMHTVLVFYRFRKATEQWNYKFKKRTETFDFMKITDEIIAFNKWLELDKAIGYKKNRYDKLCTDICEFPISN